jgi:hypothetical protein
MVKVSVRILMVFLACGVYLWLTLAGCHPSGGQRSDLLDPLPWFLMWSSHLRGGFVIFDHPPTNEDIYTTDIWSHFFEWDNGRTLYDGALRVNTWEAVVGEKPTRPLPLGK